MVQNRHLGRFCAELFEQLQFKFYKIKFRSNVSKLLHLRWIQTEIQVNRISAALLCAPACTQVFNHWWYNSKARALSPVFIWSLTIAGSVLKILPAIVTDYMETLFSDRAIFCDRQQLYGNTFQRSGDRRRSWAILCFSDSSDPSIVSDNMETRLYVAVSFLSVVVKIAQNDYDPGK